MTSYVDRAILAALDRREADWRWLEGFFHRTLKEQYGFRHEDIASLYELDIDTEHNVVKFRIDGLSLKFSVKETHASTNTSSGNLPSNHMIAGIHDDLETQLQMYLNAKWNDVEDQAAIGALLAANPTAIPPETAEPQGAA